MRERERENAPAQSHSDRSVLTLNNCTDTLLCLKAQEIERRYNSYTKAKLFICSVLTTNDKTEPKCKLCISKFAIKFGVQISNMMTIVVVQGRLNWFYRNFRFEEFKVL